ncbi:hypothetical protein JCM10908_006053 [Rhodotorula pacifica]|uniref:uncharacterized protein n=1 Tax=Rhodotorula pacifica TaxID=1495444 RepID=UPI0031724DD3
MARSCVSFAALVAAAAAFVCSTSLVPVASAFKTGQANNDVVRGGYIIQVDTSSAALSKRGMTPFAALDQTLAAVANQGVAYTVRQRFDAIPDAFMGVSMQVGDDVSIDKLAQIPGVKNVWPIRKVRLPTDVVVDDYQSVDESVMTRRDLSHDTSPPSLEKRGTTFPPASAYTNDQFYPHQDTGIDILHNRGILGAGIKIGIIDTGVDYTNPILGGCFGPGCQISFGYDFAGDAFNGNNQGQPDSDPFASCTSHGTHVTGTVGALANSYGFSGAAPAATIGHYRVFGCAGDTADDLVLAAIQRAVQVDKVDIVTMSLGSAVGWLDNTPIQIYQDYLATIGVHVVASAGNDRVEGAFFSEGPAAGLVTNAVGATDPKTLPAYQALLTGGGSSLLPYSSPAPLTPTGTYRVYFTSTNSGVANDACSALPASTPDLSNMVVVVKRGTCDFTVKLANVAKAGGKIVLVYNSQGSIVIPQLNVGTSGLQAVGSLRYEDGIKLLDMYTSKPGGVFITFRGKQLIPGVADTVSGGLAAPYTAFGPTNDMYLFPSISAPGSSILSTVPGGVGIMRGTSMAAPLVAGAYALLLSARKNDGLTPAQARALMMSTSVQAPSTYQGSTLETVTLQGAGVINAQRAVDMRTQVWPAQIMLNDTRYFNNVHTIALENRESVAVTYTLSSVNTRAIATYNTGATNQIIPSTTPNTVDLASTTVTFSQNGVTVPAGGKVEIVASFSQPRASWTQRDLFLLFSGYVRINAQLQGAASAQPYTIPFLGLLGQLVDMPVLDSTAVALGAALPFVAVGQDIQSGPANFSLSSPNGPPTCYFRLAGATRTLLLDLVDGSVNYAATIPAVQNPAQRMAKRALEARAADQPAPFPTSFSDVPVYGNIYSPYYWPPRDYLVDGPYPYSDFEIAINGTYTAKDGSAQQAVLGKSYKVLLRALRNTADPTLSASYDSWLSPPFTLKA